jgi:hypothetical protein
MLGNKRPREEKDGDVSWTRNIKPLISSILVGKAKVPVIISWPHARRNSKYFAAFEEKDLPEHVLPEWEGCPLEDPDFQTTWLMINGLQNPGTDLPASAYFLNYFNVDIHVLVVANHDGDINGPYFYVFRNPSENVLKLLQFWRDQNKAGFSSADRSCGGPPETEEEEKYDEVKALLYKTEKTNDISGLTFHFIVKICVW